tara:strand:- start:5430 stop:6116 length:687 start_codon:yes stop_codon:yes gene_type:complete
MKGAEITYGSSLVALQHAYQKGTSIILDHSIPPPVYEDEKTRSAWGLLYTKLSLSGKVIGSDLVSSCQIHGDTMITARKGNIVKKLKYNRLYVFSDKNITGLPAPYKESPDHTVVDFLVAPSLSVPHINKIKFEDKFVSEIRFLKNSIRSKTKIYVLSTLTKKQLQSFEYSDTMVRFKCEELLKAHGFTGSKNGKKKLLIKLEVTHREVHKEMDYYEDTARIKFLYAP